MDGMKSYRIVFLDNTGSHAVSVLAESCGGRWRDNVQSYNGEHDLAFIDVPDTNAAYLEDLLDDDTNVISYVGPIG